jgi:hypothetical protein
LFRSALFCLAAAAFASSTAHADEHGFTVQFTTCSEFVGWGPVGLAQAQKLVPAGYTIAGSAQGTAAIVARVTQCAAAQVGHAPAIPTILSQIGINLVSPDGTGTINNYTLLYISNNPFLVHAFQLVGVPARYDANMTYQYTLNGAATGGTLYATAEAPGIPAYFFYGTETEPPPNSAELFIANWWYAPNARIKQSSTFPAISFGTSAAAFYTSNVSPLGDLIGGNADSNFTYLSVRGEYPSATLKVTAASH